MTRLSYQASTIPFFVLQTDTSKQLLNVNFEIGAQTSRVHILAHPQNQRLINSSAMSSKSTFRAIFSEPESFSQSLHHEIGGNLPSTKHSGISDGEVHVTQTEIHRLFSSTDCTVLYLVLKFAQNRANLSTKMDWYSNI
jgi:hypothetical protein